MPPRSPARPHGRRSAARHCAPSPGRRASVGQSALVERGASAEQGASARFTSLQHQLAIVTTAVAVMAGLSIVAPTPPAQAEPAREVAPAAAQALRVAANVDGQELSRDSVSATDVKQTLLLGGTNEDWAKLVLLDGGWPLTDQNVTVMLRWMRQENGPQDWWNRNNPLNNGYGSGGGAGLGSYASLTDAARYAAANLHRGYPAVVAALAAGTSADATAAAIWASPWSSSHYANGTHWSTAPVDIVTAPASDW